MLGARFRAAGKSMILAMMGMIAESLVSRKQPFMGKLNIDMVWTFFVVMTSPRVDEASRVGEIFKPMLVNVNRRGILTPCEG